MKKYIVNRLNALKSELQGEAHQKLTKTINEDKVIALLSRIDELKRLILHYEKSSHQEFNA